MKLAINKSSVVALREYADQISQTYIKLDEDILRLLGIYNSVFEKVGPHNEMFEEMLFQIKKAEEISNESIEKLSDMLRYTADKIEAYINRIPQNTSYGTVTSENGDARRYSSIGRESVTPKISCESASRAYQRARDYLDKKRVEYRPILKMSQARTNEEIISRLGGGDRTKGSCSSLAFAYAGNKAGYDVLDFRNGESLHYFSDNSSISTIAAFPGVKSKVVSGKDDIACADQLLSEMKPGKEYYLATGEHASIVRLNNGHYEYLELQSATDNGWHLLHDTRLYERFGCAVNDIEYTNFLIDIDSLGSCSEFLDLLGYINTAQENQHKGDSGHVR